MIEKSLSPDGIHQRQNPGYAVLLRQVPLYVTRPVRWDSGHVVLFDDETREIMKEVVRNSALDPVHNIGIVEIDGAGGAWRIV